MPHKTLPAQIAEWRKARENEKIRDAVLALPESERTDKLVCLLARALNNEGDYEITCLADDFASFVRGPCAGYCKTPTRRRSPRPLIGAEPGVGRRNLY